MSEEQPHTTAKAKEAPNPFVTGLTMTCPVCGKGKLFDGYLTLRKSCEHCGADFAELDSGDGPAFFVMFIVSLLVVIPAIFMEILYSPPYWLYAVIFLPVGAFFTFVLLRPCKALLVAAQVHFRAAQWKAGEEAGDHEDRLRASDSPPDEKDGNAA